MEATPSERAALWRLLFITMTTMLNSVEADLKAGDDLTLLDVGCLFALNTSADGGVPMGSLAVLFAVDPSVITYRIKRLEARGLVARTVCEHNRRFTLAMITGDGRRFLRKARTNLLASADRHFFAHLDRSEAAALTHVYSTLLAAQQRDRHTPRDDLILSSLER